MAKTIKNDDAIIIKRKFVDDTEGEVEKEVSVGRYYFEATRELKQCSIQIYFDEVITNESEKLQIGDIFNKEYLNFITDSEKYGWDILKNKENVDNTGTV